MAWSNLPEGITMRPTTPILYRCRGPIKPGVGISRSNLMSRDRGVIPAQSITDFSKRTFYPPRPTC